MEDMARLAVFESNLRDSVTFGTTLQKLLEHIRCILDNPEASEHRNISSDSLKKSLDVEGFTEYLKYIGFEINNGELIYPKYLSLNKLKMAETAIERKLKISCGAPSTSKTKLNVVCSQNIVKKPKSVLPAVNLSNTRNQYLQTLANLFNDILKHEEEELQQLAREHIPLVTLQTKALERMREQQRKIKSGEIKGTDLSFDMALLMELLGWFKYSFFKWVDKPPCEECGGQTRFIETVPMKTEAENIRLELYRCVRCPGAARFPRHRAGRSLLRSRRGRCGEWADCFTLLCRALGYDTRYVHDTTDHVWCEIFDYESNRWLHVDPCEAKLDAPLIYEHGWGKKLQYVIAVSRDDIQDVTWRYTSDHKSVEARRNLCSEAELIAAILSLREQRQRPLSAARRHYLAKRCLQELVQMMVEKKPSDYESHGRISGSKEWRSQRREIGQRNHTFDFTAPGCYRIRYLPIADKYEITQDNKENSCIETWSNGLFECKNIFRKEEKDWRMVYLAREEGEDFGSMSWRLSANDNIILTSLTVIVAYKLYESGKIVWKAKFDAQEPTIFNIGESSHQFDVSFKSVVLTAELTGGQGDVAWQHAQIFRQSMDDDGSGLDLHFVATAV